MTILVAGNAGYLGSVLIPRLEKKLAGMDAIIPVDLGIFKITNKYIPVDLSRDSYTRIFGNNNVKSIIHLAGISNDPSSELDPKLTERMNVDASKRLIDFAAASGVKKFIFASSASVYGANNFLVTEESTDNPQSLYAKSKLEVEKYLLDFKELNPVIFRFGTLFGVSPKMRFDIAINLMVKDAITTGKINIFGTGEQYRPFLHVCDAASALLSADSIMPGIYNLAYTNIRIKSLAEIVSSITNAEIVYQAIDHPDTRNYRMNCEKAKLTLPKEALPNTSIVYGIEELAAWVKNHDANDIDYYTIQAWKRYLDDSVF